jgi:hypothetical protein
MATKTAVAPLKEKDAVVALHAERGVPVGTPGKVIHVQGLTWIRYWVLFDNGLRVGTLDRAKLATPDEWARRMDSPVAGAIATGTAALGVGGDSGSVAGAVVGTGAGGDVGGVPGHLLERSRLARERKGAPKP